MTVVQNVSLHNTAAETGHVASGEMTLQISKTKGNESFCEYLSQSLRVTGARNLLYFLYYV